jgi:hypothetical protein
MTCKEGGGRALAAERRAPPIDEPSKFVCSPNSDTPRFEQALDPSLDDPDRYLRRRREVAKESADRAVLFAWAHAAYAPTAGDLAEFLTRAGEATARVLADEGVARDPTLAGAADFHELCADFAARCAELAADATWIGGLA